MYRDRIGLNAAILLEDASNQAKFLRYMAQIRESRGNIDEAEHLSERALELYRQLGDRVGISHCLFRLASIEQTRGNFTHARQLADDGFTLAQDIGKNKYIILMCGRLASIELSARDYDTAERYLKRALERNESMDTMDTGQLECSWINRLLGRVHFAKNDFQRASERFQASLEISERISSSEDVAETRYSIPTGDGSGKFGPRRKHSRIS